MEINVLKPCPFCGGKANIDRDYTNNAYVYCTKCEISTRIYMTGLNSLTGTQQAIEAWNRRV